MLIALRSTLLKRLHHDWERRRNGREFPSRADFDPLELRYIVGRLSFIDVLAPPGRYRYRLHGTKVADRIGCDLTGKEVDEIGDKLWRERLRQHLSDTIEQRRPIAIVWERICSDERTWNCETIVFPLARDGTTIDMLMSSAVWL